MSLRGTYLYYRQGIYLREAISKKNLLVSLIVVLFIITAETLWIE